jgi:iron complex outermembrane receptor protein
MRMTPLTAALPVLVLGIGAAGAIAQTSLPEIRVEDRRESPLNIDQRADSASRLGLTARETPATVEIIDQGVLRQRGYRTVTEAAAAMTGVTAGDHPAEPAAFSLRGFTNSQINILYNGVKIGPQNMTSRVMDTANLERIEVLKGPASLISGEGAAGGAINFVSKKPHRGPVENEIYASYGSNNTARLAVGSGGSTAKDGLDYRFDLSRSSSDGFINDTASRNAHLSGALDFRVSTAFKLFGAVEHKNDHANPYWGTPLVPVAFAGANAAGGIVAGSYVSNYNGSNLGAVTIDNRSLSTNYNVLDNYMKAEETMLRGGFEWALRDNLTLRDQVYYYKARREWFNNEVIAFNSGTGLIDRERFFVAHDQKLYGNKAELQWDSKPAGMDNRLVAALDTSTLDFVRPGAANFPADTVPVVDPVRGLYGLLTLQKQTTGIRNTALSLEDRLKVTPAFALIGGLRYETIDLDRTSLNAAGANRAGFPFSKTFHPLTGRLGATYEAWPGFTLYSQYATAADVAANNIFLIGAGQPVELTRVRSYEAGIKHTFWERRAEWTFAVFDIARNNVYSAQGGRTLNVAGKQQSNGVELSAAVRPATPWQIWGNAAYTHAYYTDYNFAGGSFSGNAPPNVPRVVANAGVVYRTALPLPLEMGVTVRHVGDRYHSDANTVKLLAYTVGDAYASVDIRKTKLTARVRNITNERYAAWSDAFYPDQILLGAPRSYEISAVMKF